MEQWANALQQGADAISDLGGAKPGDRTILDALDPFANTLKRDVGKKSITEAVVDAVAAGERGAVSTAQMKPRLGRSSYLGDRVLGHQDPGAQAIMVWLRAAAEALLTQSE
jgi:dihydroxyacetone kinase